MSVGGVYLFFDFVRLSFGFVTGRRGGFEKAGFGWRLDSAAEFKYLSV